MTAIYKLMYILKMLTQQMTPSNTTLIQMETVAFVKHFVGNFNKKSHMSRNAVFLYLQLEVTPKVLCSNRKSKDQICGRIMRGYSYIIDWPSWKGRAN